MSFCGKCGAEIKDEKFCPQCGEAVETGVENSITNHSNSIFGWKKIAIVGAISVVLIVAVFSIASKTYTVNKPCDWCGDRLSVEYKTSDGSRSYVCKSCNKTCAFCGDKATKRYENLFGMMVPVCKKCYKSYK